MIALLSLTAQAASLSLGSTSVYNQPGSSAHGVIAGVAQPIAPGLLVGVSGSAFPSRRDPVITQNHLVFGVSPRLWDASASLIFEPFRGTVGGMETALGLYVGGGVVRTWDDLDALQGHGDPRSMASARQHHLAQVAGVTSDVVLSPTLALRARWHTVAYVETLNATQLDFVRSAQLGLEAVLTPGGR